MLNKYNQKGQIKSPLYALEANGNESRANMEEWAKFTERKFNLDYINGTHWEIFTNYSNISAIKKVVENINN